ncbi:hypothetical protein FB451DRAFT_1127200 [Mycena latifolia]|nr:hypothetical protein FB451DRAFT_1127200 [Mycena latifolia]
MTEDADTRVEDLWFSSDSLVIRAEKKIFRVTKSILAARSSVFRDMVAFPQPASGEAEIIDGSPVVCLSDSAANVEVFLRAIFDSSYFMPPPAPVELLALLGILRLAHKYDVQYLYLRALEHIAVRYAPLSLDDYSTSQYRDHIIYPADSSPVYILGIIMAATEVEALWLLPIAYYLACTYPQKTIRSAVALGASEHLVQMCIAGQAELIRGTVKVNSFLSKRSDAQCESAGRCEMSRVEGFNGYLSSLDSEEDLTPLDDWPASDWAWFLRTGRMCRHCIQSAQESHTAALEEFWERLPLIFGLPSWSELHAMRDVVMGSPASNSASDQGFTHIQ